MISPLQPLEVTLRWQCVQLLYQWTYSWSQPLHYSLEPLPPCPPPPSMSRSTCTSLMYISFQFPSWKRNTACHYSSTLGDVLYTVNASNRDVRDIWLSVHIYLCDTTLRNMACRGNTTYCEPNFLHTVISYT